MPRLFWLPWRWWRRIAQFVFLAVFLWMFRRTEFGTGSDLSWQVNWLFRLDPLVAASAMLAARQVIVSVLIPSLVVLLLTAILGRFFCGWVCPLGTMLDYFHRLIRPIARPLNRRAAPVLRRLRGVRVALMILVLTAAAMAVPLVGFLDPFAIFFRGWAVGVDPGLRAGSDALFGWLYFHGGDRVTAVSEPVYSFLKDHVLPSQQSAFQFAGATLGVLIAVFALELVGRRMWCRILCPLGGMLGLVSRFSWVKRLPAKTCAGCAACSDVCRMDAFEAGNRLVPEACNLCMDCVDVCPKTIAKFKPKHFHPIPAAGAPETSRRMFIASVVGGVAVPAVAWATGLARPRTIDPELLRPPGTPDEADFLNLCVRCGECMKVCPTNALHPTFLQAGVAGMFSPYLVPRLGYCEYNCTLCGQVCPTGAIPHLIESVKQTKVIGQAEFLKDKCLPWAKNEPCIVCEEHCPIADKAIKVDVVKVKSADGEEIELQRPYVEPTLCVGCGICENKCPITGEAGVRVRRAPVPATA